MAMVSRWSGLVGKGEPWIRYAGARPDTRTRTRLVATGPGWSLGHRQPLFCLEACFLWDLGGWMDSFFGRYFCVCERQGVVGVKPDTQGVNLFPPLWTGAKREDLCAVCFVLHRI